jgi:hypothetical protein
MATKKPRFLDGMEFELMTIQPPSGLKVIKRAPYF